MIPKIVCGVFYSKLLAFILPKLLNFRNSLRGAPQDELLLQDSPLNYCVKSVQIRSYFWSVLFCIRSEYRKIRTRKNSVSGLFSHSDYFNVSFLVYNIRISFFSYFLLAQLKIGMKRRSIQRITGRIIP